MKTDLGRIHTTAAVTLLTIGLIFCLGGSLSASVSPDQLRVPDDNTVQVLTLNDGSILTGRIRHVESDKILFASEVGELSISVEKIADIREVSRSSIRNGKYWFTNPNQTRLYFSPTGRMLRAGQGYFSDFYIFFPSVSYGITDNFSMSGGMSLLPGIGLGEQIYYFFPRVGFRASNRVAIAGSVLMIRIPYTEGSDGTKRKTAGILFGSCTLGSEDYNFTFGLGHGYIGNDFASKPAIMFGWQMRFARRLSFVSENWVFPGIDNPLISYGLRFFGENISVDLGFFNVASGDIIFPGIPLVGFTWGF